MIKSERIIGLQCLGVAVASPVMASGIEDIQTGYVARGLTELGIGGLIAAGTVIPTVIAFRKQSKIQEEKIFNKGYEQALFDAGIKFVGTIKILPEKEAYYTSIDGKISITNPEEFVTTIGNVFEIVPIVQSILDKEQKIPEEYEYLRLTQALLRVCPEAYKLFSQKNNKALVGQMNKTVAEFEAGYKESQE